MSDILYLQEQLQDTSEAIAKSQQAVASDPASKAATAMLRSVEKRREKLEHQFLLAAQELGVDVCSYRFFSDLIRPLVSPLCNALIEFQSLYSLAYDAIKYGPKKPGKKVSPDVIEETAFGFGYTFAGSLGVVLTFDNSKRLLFETALDESMREIETLARATTSADVSACGKRLGAPVVRAAHRWASAHAESSLGAEIAWKKGDDVLVNLLLEARSFADLVETIGTTTETITEEMEMVAKLAGADTEKRTFHLVLPDEGEIQGRFSDEISHDQTFEVGRPHKVRVRKRVRVYYATDKEEAASYQLLSASPSTYAQLF